MCLLQDDDHYLLCQINDSITHHLNIDISLLAGDEEICASTIKSAFMCNKFFKQKLKKLIFKKITF